MPEVLSFPWNTFQRLQTSTNSDVVNARAYGRDEALTVIMDELAAGKVPPDEETMERRFRTLSANRAVKYRTRRQLEIEATDHYRVEPVMQDLSDELAVQELVELASSQIAPDDWQLLQDIGNGESYVELALNRRKKAGTLKSTVSRLRCHMRKSEIGRVILEALQLSSGDLRKWASLRHRRTPLRAIDQILYSE